MLPLTRLLDTDLWAVESANDATNFRIGKTAITNKTIYAHGGYDGYKICQLPDNNFEILGTVDKDSIFFDVEPYVKRGGIGTYKDYTYTSKEKLDEVGLFNALIEMKFKTKEESFYSLLSASGIEFSNKLDSQKKAYFFKGSENSWGQEELQQWQQFEDKVVKNKLLILKQL